MSSYHDIPDRIRDFLSVPDQSWTQETTELALRYAAICRAANDRLRRCQEYLRRGMRSEAVHLAGCQPPLSELLPIINLPEADAWIKICTANGLPAPQVTRATGLEALQAASRKDQSLSALISLHRLQAIAVVPVVERLATARKLLAADADNPAWREAVLMLERARLIELRVRTKSAFRAGSLPQLEEIAAEIAAHRWLVAVPEDLRLGIGEAVQQTRLKFVLSDLNVLMSELTAAFEARDLERCTAAFAMWTDLVERSQITLPREFQQKLSPILRWVTTENRRGEVAARVQAANRVLEAQADETGAMEGKSKSLLKRLLGMS